MGRTAPLSSKLCILYIYSTNTGTEYFKHALYFSFFFFSSKCSLFHNANLFGSCIIHILYTGCVKIKKKFWRQRVKSHLPSADIIRSSLYSHVSRIRVNVLSGACYRAGGVFNSFTANFPKFPMSEIFKTEEKHFSLTFFRFSSVPRRRYQDNTAD